MADDERVRIDGDGYSRDPLSPDEAARVRHMMARFRREGLTAGNALETPPLKPLKPVVSILTALPLIAGAMAVAAALGVGLRWMADAGMF